MGTLKTTLKPFWEGKPVVENNGSLQGPRSCVLDPPLYMNGRGCTVRRSSFPKPLPFSRGQSRQDSRHWLYPVKAGCGEDVQELHGTLRDRGLPSAICPYRSGYFDREREEIEKKMNSGELRGVISTNALELGIDIGGLDVCILDGYPGTVMSARQQAGRAGRSGNESLVLMVAGTNALDQYYMRNPADFFARSSENAVLNPKNPYILAGHLLCAAKEIPLRESDEKYFGGGYSRVVELLEAEGLLAGSDMKYSTDPFPYKQVSLRGIDNNTYSLLAFEGKGAPIEKRLKRPWLSGNAIRVQSICTGENPLHKQDRP